MEIHFKVIHTKEAGNDEISPKATDFAERKIRSLKKYLGKEHADLGVQVYVELGKSTEAHQTGPIWRAQIKLDAPGERFLVHAVGEHIELAITSAVAELEQKLRKYKAKRKNMLHRGGAAVKSFMRGFSSP